MVKVNLLNGGPALLMRPIMQVESYLLKTPKVIKGGLFASDRVENETLRCTKITFIDGQHVLCQDYVSDIETQLKGLKK